MITILSACAGSHPVLPPPAAEGPVGSAASADLAAVPASTSSGAADAADAADAGDAVADPAPAARSAVEARGHVVLCQEGATPGPCPTGCEAGPGCFDATVVGVAPLFEGTVEVGARTGSVGYGGDGDCRRYTVDPGATSVPGTTRAVRVVPAPLPLWSMLGGAPEGGGGEAWAVDLDDDGAEETVFSIAKDERRIVGVVTSTGRLEIGYDTARPWATSSVASVTLDGVTDLGLDGELELVLALDAAGEEAVAVLTFRNGVVERAGGMGCRS